MEAEKHAVRVISSSRSGRELLKPSVCLFLRNPVIEQDVMPENLNSDVVNKP